MTDVLKISLPGIDVKTARPDQCVVHSDYPNPKINKHANPAHRGLISVILNNTYQTGETVLFSFPHGYSYVPMVWATIAEVNTSNPNIFGFQPYVSGQTSVEVRCNATNFLIVYVNNTGVSQQPLIQLNVSYAIFADNGANP